MKKDRYNIYQVTSGQEDLKEFMDMLQSLNVLPAPQPVGIGPNSYMCAANMDTLLVGVDEGKLVADIVFRNVPVGCPELLGIVGINLANDFATAYEIGKSLILDVLYGEITPSEVRLVSDSPDIEGGADERLSLENVVHWNPAKQHRCSVSRNGTRYEVVRKYLERNLSEQEMEHLNACKEAEAERKAKLTEPVVMTYEEIKASNMDAFYAALSEAGVTAIVGRYDGYGDDGKFEGIRAVCGQKLTELPVRQVRYGYEDDIGRRGQTSQRAVMDVLHEVVDDILSDIQDDWDLIRGTFFKFRCDIERREFHINVFGGDLNDDLVNLDLTY